VGVVVLTATLLCRSISATWLPLSVRAYINWIFLSGIAVATFYTSQRLDASKYETVQADEVVDYADDDSRCSDETVARRV
jgi:hypothetical protein